MSNEILIGAQLREARLNKHITIDELQQKTKITKRYLEALEAGAFEQLPGEYYVRSFIRQYSEIVELDGEHLVAVFDGKADFGPALPKRPQPEHIEGSRKAQHVAERQKKAWIDYLPVILLGLVAMTVLGVVFYMSWSSRHAKPIINQTETSVSVHNQVSSVAPSKESTPKPSETTTEKPKEMKIERTVSTADQATMAVTNATDPLNLNFTAKNGRCWVGVVVNGSYVYQYTFAAGETKSFALPAGTKVATIVLGASQYMKITANDKEVGFEDSKFDSLQKNILLNIAYL